MPTLVGGLPGWGGAAALCARSRGEPSSAHCEQRLSDGSPLARANPCAPAPEYGEKVTRISVSDPTRSAASRDGMAGWAGEGGGRFGERREYEAPTLPSTPRQHGMARHQTRQPRNNTLCQHGTARHHTNQSRNSTQPQKPGNKQHDTTPVPNENPETLAHSNMRIAGAMAQSRH